MNTTDTLLVYKARQYIYMPVHQLSEIRWKDNGQHIGNLVQLEAGDELIKALPIRTFDTTNELLFITKQGLVKKTPLNVYKAQRYPKR
ncbi:DNA gyrase C-terminal beta-propeller domain-containing protein [Sinobaca sp. H24]|uniref:DNA gyrase C-terminal beta-propeller domain-containing protein n=1 Tax=Sinobaca sp. H24 TaxID=2923376 RepID=UPI0035B4942E